MCYTLKICDKDTALKIVDQHWDAVVSIADNKQGLVSNQVSESLNLLFEDRDDHNGISRNQLQQVVALGMRLRNKQYPMILVHCEAGMCRSPSVALVLTMSIGFEFLDAMQRVIFSQPLASFNTQILDLASDYFKKPITDLVEDWLYDSWYLWRDSKNPYQSQHLLARFEEWSLKMRRGSYYSQ